MKAFVCIIFFLFPFIAAAPAFPVEVAPRISDREIVERLTRLEGGQKAILREMDKRFEDMNSQFDRMINIMTAIVVAFAGIVAVTIVFAVWDRRTMVRPFEVKVKKVEDEIAHNRGKIHSLIEAFRTLSETDENVANILRNFDLL